MVLREDTPFPVDLGTHLYNGNNLQQDYPGIMELLLKFANICKIVGHRIIRNSKWVRLLLWDGKWDGSDDGSEGSSYCVIGVTRCNMQHANRVIAGGRGWGAAPWCGWKAASCWLALTTTLRCSKHAAVSKVCKIELRWCRHLTRKYLEPSSTDIKNWEQRISKWRIIVTSRRQTQRRFRSLRHIQCLLD